MANGAELEQKEREEARWRILRVLDAGRPVGVNESILWRVLHDVKNRSFAEAGAARNSSICRTSAWPSSKMWRLRPRRLNSPLTVSTSSNIQSILRPASPAQRSISEPTLAKPKAERAKESATCAQRAIQNRDASTFKNRPHAQRDPRATRPAHRRGRVANYRALAKWLNDKAINRQERRTSSRRKLERRLEAVKRATNRRVQSPRHRPTMKPR